MGKRLEWERNNGDVRETKRAAERRDREHDMPRRGVSGRLGLRLSAHLPTQRLPFPQGLPCLDSTFRLACPRSPGPSSSVAGPSGFTGSPLSLIGIETYSPPFSCRWGFHRKKLLLHFPSPATVWKSDPHILLNWVKSLLDRLLSIIY